MSDSLLPASPAEKEDPSIPVSDWSDWSARPHVVLLVDETTSMARSRDMAVDSLNEYVNSLRGLLPDEARVTVTFFADKTYRGNPTRFRSVVESTPLKDVVDIEHRDYDPDGNTPLNDAIGETIKTLDDALAGEDAPVYVAILTDGKENCSKSFTSEQIKELVSERRARGWTFTFLGVDIDAYDPGLKMGFGVDDTVSVKRGKMSAGISAAASSTTARYAMAKKSASSAVYGSVNLTASSFSPELKKDLESDD